MPPEPRFVSTPMGAAALVGVGACATSGAFALAHAHEAALLPAAVGLAVCALVAWLEAHHGRRM